MYFQINWVKTRLIFVSHSWKTSVCYETSEVGYNPTILFLSIRVTKSTRVAWVKLKSLLENLSNTINMSEIIGTDEL